MTPAALILRELEKKRRVQLPHVDGALRAQIAAELIAHGKRPILVAKDQTDAEALYRDLAFMLATTDEEARDRGLVFVGADEKSPYEEYSPDTVAVMERINALYRLAKEPKTVRAAVVTPHAFVKKHVPPSFFDDAGEYVMKDEEIDRKALLAKLVASGYNSVSKVEDPGTFSVRGGIIDVYSPHRALPVRLDLFGDTIDSLRLFDPASQRAQDHVEDAVLLPAREIVFDDEVTRHAIDRIETLAEETLIPTRKLNAILDDIQNHIHFFGIEAYLPLFHAQGLVGIDEYLMKGDDVVYLVSQPEGIETTSMDLLDEARLGYERALAAHQVAVEPSAHVEDGELVLERATKSERRVDMPDVVFGDVEPLRVKYQTTEEVRSEILRASRSRSDSEDVLAPLVERLRKWQSEGLTALIVCHTRGQAERMRQLLEPKNVSVRRSKVPFSLPEFLQAKATAKEHRSARGLRDRSVHAWLVLGDISGGFVLPSAHLAVIAEEEIFGRRMKRRRRRAPAAGEFVSDLKDLQPGDYVVHVDYGIGHYKAMTKLAVNGVDSDYLEIEYKGGDKLYLPVHRLRLISKYVTASEGRSPALDKLGGTSWAKTKKRVKDTLLKMAAELLRLYAVRASQEGHAFEAPDEVYRQFEAEFEFEPTPDQAKAIEDTIADMQKPHPMDRLICGDVGYGKTEVAMRAAMMTVLGRKQVAILVPTTVLAAQHYSVFKKRFENYPVEIAIVSRFQSKEELKKTFEAVKDGKVDIVIGTHRLLNKDVKFNDVGLLVIDEEHRFGVTHKERLKKYRAQVHVLALSATPIPRTLHMGFMGVRDMSMIATAPQDRLAVKTEVHKFSEEVIRKAIIDELRRGGQAFVVHNRVSSIYAFAKMLERLVPEARIGVGHGQMSEDRLERVMVDFMEKKTNVLLSTTIIESGIDIPNANTIVINRADRLGLAQLYQLKGRVGRSKTRGYAHFLIPAGNLTKKARARIAVLQRFTELGAGFQVASKDLEIRGAGNILGKQQAGTIAAIGFDMYQALLKEAIDELQGSARKSLKEPEIQIPVPAFIPDAYVPAPGERLSFYQRFNNAETDERTYDLLQEITDLYGNPPAEVENLAEVMLVKQRLWRVGAIGLDYGAETKAMPPRFVVRFDEGQTELSPEALVKYVQKDARRRKVTPDGKLMVYLSPFEDPREIITQVKDQLSQLLSEKQRAQT